MMLDLLRTKGRHVTRCAMAAVHDYVEDLFRLDIQNDAVRQEIFARQLEATTAAVRWLTPVLLLVTFLTVLTFWNSGSKTCLLAGEMIHVAAGSWSWRTLPIVIVPKTAFRSALLHIAGAVAQGSGIALVSIGVAFDHGIHTLMFNSCWQLAFISVSLVFYVNLPAAFFSYALPITVPFTYSFLMAHDRTSIVAPFLIIYLGVLARMAMDQKHMFVAAGRNALRLRETEAEARAAAEEKMRRVEQLSVATRAGEDARRREMVALAERFERNVVDVADSLTATVEGLDQSARQMVDVTRYSASTAEDVAARTTNAAASLATVATAANGLANAVGAIAVQIEGHAELSGRATRSAVDSATRIAAMSAEAERISSIITLIKSITAQTKLLALNATIEAARAGEAGRGFSIVAQEVKTLAHHASDATGQVTNQVGSILSRIEPATASIRSTAKEIDGVAMIASAIASSIVQQRSASEAIDCETGVVAHHVEDIRVRMAGLVKRANEAELLTNNVSNAAEHVSAQADTLQRAASDFLRELRAA